MIRKILFAVFSIAVIVQAIQAQEGIDQKPSFLAVVPRDFPPQYSVDDEGKPTGFAIEVMNHIALIANIEIHYILADTWTQADETLRSGQADLIPNLGITASREQYFSFTSPVEVFSISIFVRKQDKNIKSVDDLSGHKVAAVEYNVGVSLLENLSGVDLVIYNTPSEALFDLLAENVDALVYPQPVLLQIARQIDLEDRIKTVGEPLLTVKRAIAVRKDNELLLAKLNTAVGKFVGSKTYQKIYSKWYGRPKPFWNTKRVVMLMAALFFCVFLSMGAWRYHSLRMLNKKLNLIVTQLSQARKDLKASEEQFRSIFDSVDEYIFILDKEYNLLYMNPAACNLFELGCKRFVGGNLSKVFGEDTEITRNLTTRIGRVFNKKKSSTNEEVLYIHGKQFYLHSSFSPIRDAEGSIFAVGVIFSDITPLKKAETKLKRQLYWMSTLNEISQSIASRNNVESILGVVITYLDEAFSCQLSAVGIYNLDKGTIQIDILKSKEQNVTSLLGVAEGSIYPADLSGIVNEMELNKANVVNVSDTKITYLPVSKSQHAGLKTAVFIPIKEEDTLFRIIIMLFREEITLNEYENSFLGGVAEQISLAVQKRKLYKELNESYIELQRTQQKVMEQERLNAMGQMASGIAHDINNTLAPISLYTEALLESEPDLSEKARRFLNTIQSAAKDIENTTMRMRMFYRRQEDEASQQAVDLNGTVTQIIELTRPRWEDMPHRKGIDVEIKTDLQKNLPPLTGMESEIREALVNLVFNAVDAMPEGGTLKISTNLQEPYIIVTVSDSGTGMDEEQNQRCIEPFYTTKGELGTGLGLSMVFGVMQRHGGDMNIESEVGRGTTIGLLFPLVEHKPAEAEEAVAATALPSLHILCIDDNVTVREALKEILLIDGHALEVAQSGKEGLEVFRTQKEQRKSFDLVITDLGMPHMDGREVAREIKRTSPDTPVILLSGWGTYINLNGETFQEVDCILGKPPKIAELRAAIKKVLSNRAFEE